VFARLGLGLGLGLGLTAGACRRQSSPPPPHPALGAVVARNLTPPEETAGHLDLPALESELGVRLRATGLFADPSDAGAAGPVARVRAEVGVQSAEVGDSGLARARVGVIIETRPSDAPGAIQEQLQGQGERPYPVRKGSADDARAVQAVFDGLVQRIARDLVDGFAARRRLESGSAEAVHAALLADGGELREEAIRLAGERRLRDEVPALLKLLSDPDEPTRDAALGALIAMREPRAVTELTRTRSQRDRREMRKIVEAIGILGGREAEDYLAFVAQTNDDEEIRAAAAAAKARLERHATDGGNRP
jgi:hypothetical protein